MQPGIINPTDQMQLLGPDGKPMKLVAVNIPGPDGKMIQAMQLQPITPDTNTVPSQPAFPTSYPPPPISQNYSTVQNPLKAVSNAYSAMSQSNTVSVHQNVVPIPTAAPREVKKIGILWSCSLNFVYYFSHCLRTQIEFVPDSFLNQQAPGFQIQAKQKRKKVISGFLYSIVFLQYSFL